MKIGIDISQIAHEGTGVARYVRNITSELVKDKTHEFVLFSSSLRKRHIFYDFFSILKKKNTKIRLVVVPIPPTLLTILWNTLHVVPIEFFVGDVDVFWSSDWTQPPLKHARGITTIHDVSFLLYPESFAAQIVTEQKKRLAWAQKECDMFLCDSDATKNDVRRILGISSDKLQVVYPGLYV